MEKIDLGYAGYVDLRGFNGFNLDSALIVVPDGEFYNSYNMSIKPRFIRKGERLVEPLKFKVLDSRGLYGSTEDVEKELDRRALLHENLGIMLMKEVMPLNKPLDYRLNLAVLLYVLCNDYLEIHDSVNPEELN